MNFNNATMMEQKQQEREAAISAVKIQAEATIATVITSLLTTENELAKGETAVAAAKAEGEAAVAAAKADGEAAVAAAKADGEEELVEVKASLAAAVATSAELTEALSAAQVEARKAVAVEEELVEVKASLALAVEALKQYTEAVSTTQSKVIETTNMERNVTTNTTTGITSESIIKNDKYISDIGLSLIPFSQLSNKQFNQYLRAIGR